MRARAWSRRLAFAGFLLWAAGGAAQEGTDLAGRRAAADEACRRAKAEETAARSEEDSREMARSATREIARAEGEKLDRAKRDKRAADALVGELSSELAALEKDARGRTGAAALPEAEKSIAAVRTELEAARELVALREAGVKRLEESFAKEDGLYREKQTDLDAAERRLADKVLAARRAEQMLRGLRLEEAREDLRRKNEVRDRAREALAAATVEEEKKAARAACEQASAAVDAAARACEDARRSSDQAELMVLLARQVQSALELSRKTPDKGYRDPGGDAQKLKDTLRRMSAETYAAAVRLQGGLDPLPPEQWDESKARHLLVRAGFGGTPEETRKLCAQGLHKAVDSLVDYAFLPAPDAPFEILPPGKDDALASQVRQLGIRGAEGLISSRQAAPRDHHNALRTWWVKRMVESPRQLQEKLTLFWHGHFASQFSVVGHTYAMYRQNQLFREHASGNFGTLLYGIVHDGAMLRYLDNHRNVKGKPNENLAREIMELFAMGVDQGYRQIDIIEGARALTGYTCDPVDGLFRFAHEQHDGGQKALFGRPGPWTGDDFVRLLLDQPATSRFVAGKLYAFFAQQEPDRESVERLASVLRANNFELAPTLKNLFLSAKFYSAEVRGTLIKSPVQLVIGTLKDLGITRLADYKAADQALREMGQELFEPPDVKGWRYGRSWITSARVLTRYNRAADLVRTASRPGGAVGADVAILLDAGQRGSAADVVDALARAVLIPSLSPEKRTELIGALGALPPAAAWDARKEEVGAKLRNVLVLLMSTPEFQMF